MKLRNLLWGSLACCALAVFTACEPEGLGAASLTVSATSLSFEIAGGDQALTLNATRDWRVTSSEDWAVVDPAAGEASGDAQTVVVSVAENTGVNRTATLTFTIGMVEKKVTVSQAGTGEAPGNEPIDPDTPITIAQFLAQDVSAEVFYTVTGTVAVIEEMNSQYHNATLSITDETGVLYVYRMKSTNGTNLDEMGITVGDELTIKGNRGEYNGAAQMTNGVYVSHVDKEAPAGNYNASIVFADKGYENAQSVDGETIVIDDVVSCVFSKAAANNAPAYYTSGAAIRMYQNGATLDITATGGKTIKKIEFSFGSNMYYLGCDTGTLSAEGPVRTWEGSATTVKFTATGTTSSTRAYVASIKVQYE